MTCTFNFPVLENLSLTRAAMCLSWITWKTQKHKLELKYKTTMKNHHSNLPQSWKFYKAYRVTNKYLNYEDIQINSNTDQKRTQTNSFTYIHMCKHVQLTVSLLTNWKETKKSRKAWECEYCCIRISSTEEMKTNKPSQLQEQMLPNLKEH